jgi:hypothetical protein
MVTTRKAKATFQCPSYGGSDRERSSLGFEPKYVAATLTIFLWLSLQEESLLSSFFHDVLFVTNSFMFM